MQFAIQQLEHAEEILKENLEDGALSEANISKMKDQLNEVQNAILVLNASQQIINIGQLMALRKLQK